MSNPSHQQLAAHFEFARLAAQYHASGRFAALSHCIPVAGNLLHHSIEMFLKCVLVKTLTLNELKTLGHNLTILWNRFTQIHPNPTHAALNSAVAELEKFERLRYPDSVVLEGMQVSFVIPGHNFPHSLLARSHRTISSSRISMPSPRSLLKRLVLTKRHSQVDSPSMRFSFYECTMFIYYREEA